MDTPVDLMLILSDLGDSPSIINREALWLLFNEGFFVFVFVF